MHIFQTPLLHSAPPGSDQARVPAGNRESGYHLLARSSDYICTPHERSVTLEIVASKGNVIRTYSSATAFPSSMKDTRHSMYWIRPARALPTRRAPSFHLGSHYAPSTLAAGGTGWQQQVEEEEWWTPWWRCWSLAYIGDYPSADCGWEEVHATTHLEDGSNVKCQTPMSARNLNRFGVRKLARTTHPANAQAQICCANCANLAEEK